MLTARRMRERQEAEASGNAPPPRPARRQDIPWYEHEGALVALETRLRTELAVAPPAATLEIKFDEEPFRSAVEALVADLEAKAKEAIDAAAVENAELQGKLTDALKLVADLEAKAKEAASAASKPKAR